MSLSLNFTQFNGPPTWPVEVSCKYVNVAGAEVSVYPKPSITGQAKTAFMNVRTSPAIGADPVIISFTLPPVMFLISLKTTLS